MNKWIASRSRELSNTTKILRQARVSKKSSRFQEFQWTLEGKSKFKSQGTTRRIEAFVSDFQTLTPRHTETHWRVENLISVSERIVRVFFFFTGESLRHRLTYGLSHSMNSLKRSLNIFLFLIKYKSNSEQIIIKMSNVSRIIENKNYPDLS